MGINTIFHCQCGAEVEVEDFPVDETSLKGEVVTKRDVIGMAKNQVLASCPNCDPNFTGETLEFMEIE